MGLQETFQRLAVTVVKAFGNIAKTSVYVQEGPQKLIGGIVRKTTTTDTPDIIYDEFEKDELGTSFDGTNNILASDVKGLLPKLNLTKISKPKSGDKVTDDEGEEYTVLTYKTDPAKALFVLHLRSI